MKPYILVNQDVKSWAACWTGVMGVWVGGGYSRDGIIKKKKVEEICATDHEEM